MPKRMSHQFDWADQGEKANRKQQWQGTSCTGTERKSTKLLRFVMYDSIKRTLHLQSSSPSRVVSATAFEIH